jgi:hypothetical protein
VPNFSSASANAPAYQQRFEQRAQQQQQQQYGGGGGGQQQQQQQQQRPPPQQKQRYAAERGGDAGAPKVYCNFAIHKSKTAVQMSAIKPTFELLPNGSKQKKRDGAMFLEFAPVAAGAGQKQYDWSRKQSISLSPLEFMELSEALAANRGVNFFHDPWMGTSRQGETTKSLKAEPMPDGSGGIFLNLTVASGGGRVEKLNIAVSFQEFAVFREVRATARLSRAFD